MYCNSYCNKTSFSHQVGKCVQIPWTGRGGKITNWNAVISDGMLIKNNKNNKNKRKRQNKTKQNAMCHS